MEKFFLCTFFSYNKLNVVDHENVDGSVFFTEFIHRRGVTTTDRFDNFIGKFLGSNIQNFCFRISFQDEMSNGMHQVGFSKSRSTINIKRVVSFSRRFRYC